VSVFGFDGLEFLGWRERARGSGGFARLPAGLGKVRVFEDRQGRAQADRGRGIGIREQAAEGLERGGGEIAKLVGEGG